MGSMCFFVGNILDRPKTSRVFSVFLAMGGHGLPTPKNEKGAGVPRTLRVYFAKTQP